MPGPPPKREEARRRRNKDEIPTTKVNLDEVLAMEVEIPVADPNWDPLTLQFWESFSKSGQSIWYEPSDWMAAYTLMEALDRWFKPQDIKVGERETREWVDDDSDGSPVYIEGKEYIFEQKIIAPPAGLITAVYKALGDLMAMEGPRRRLRIELERRKALDEALSGDGTVVSIVKNREDLFG